MNIEDLLEVRLLDDDNFLKVKETLTRIGISSKKDNTLYHSCHILHKQGKYYILHFKELFLLDGRTSNIDENDIRRRNTIAKLLDEWNLVEIVSPNKFDDTVSMKQIKVIPYKDKSNWTLIPKYNIGKRK